MRPALAKSGVFVGVLLLGCLTASVVAWGGDSPPAATDPTAAATDTSTDWTTTPESTVPDVTDAKRQALHRKQVASLKRDISFLRQSTWHWQYISFVSMTPGLALEKRSNDTQYLRWRVKVWGLRRDKARYYALHPPHMAQWNCIHRGEGAWNDSGYPYWGGLQMDLGFQNKYGKRFYQPLGPRGPTVTADHWTPLEQMWTAEQALKAGRGFYPWPNTARACRLI